MTNRLTYILLAVLSLLCLSCSEDVSSPSVREYPVEVMLGCDMTKVGVEGNDLFWEYGDQVAFRATGASGETAVAVLTLNDVDSGLPEAKFRGSVTMTEAPVRCEFAYPATAFDVEDAVIFDYSHQDGTHKPYLYGTEEYSADGMTCTLGHVGGLIRLTVPAGVESLSLSSNSGEYITLTDGSSGYEGQKISKVSLAGQGGFAVTDDASHLIEVEVPSESDVVYAFVPAIEFVDGFSIVFNHQDGSRMFRSYSENGGKYSAYDFAAGTVIDLGIDDYQGFVADCECAGSHTYDADNILTGTEVSVTGFTFSGSPSKVIDQWGVAVYDEDDNFIRWASGQNSYVAGKQIAMNDYTGDWPLLIPEKKYKVYAICSINGHTLTFPASKTLSVGHPNITVTPIAETSWSYRSDPDKANAAGNNTIERFAFKINVSNSIVSNASYGFKARMQNTTSGADSGEIGFAASDGLNMASSTSTGEYELKQGNGLFVLGGLEWKSHNVTASVTFAGRTYSASTIAYVTGLPYRHDFRDAEGLDGGVMSGDNEYHSMNGYQLYYVYYWNAFNKPAGDKSVYYSRTFPVPDEINVQYSTGFLNACTGLSTGSTTVYTGITTSTSTPSTTSSQAISSKGDGTFDSYGSMAAKEEDGCVLTGTGKFSSSSRISASTAGTSNPPYGVQYGAFLSKMEILYSK